MSQDLAPTLSLVTAWESYSRATLGPLADPIRVQKARIDFYSGALAVITFQEIVSDPKVSMRVGEAVPLRLRDECETFKAEQLGEDPPEPSKPSLILVKP